MGLAPSTQTAVYYSYDVLVNWQKVGILQKFSASSNRTLERIREIANSSTDTVEIIPGRTERTIDIDRFETYSKNLIMALGYEPADIGDLNAPITIVEVMHKPDGGKRQIIYQDCWPQSWSKSITVGTTTITENVKLEVTNITVKNV